MQIQVTVAFLIDKLAHLIGKQYQAIIFAFVFDIVCQFHTEAVDTDGIVALVDMVVKGVAVKLRIEFTSGIYNHLQGLIHQIGSLAGIVPIATHLGNHLLKLFQQPTLHQRFFQKLC